MIHFKVAANNSFRRFSLASVTLASLKTQVASIFGVTDLNGWTIKYSDEENQLITITSEEELLFAVQISEGKVLHLLITFSPAENRENSSKHEGKRHARKAVRLAHKQERMREKLASINPEENFRLKDKASKLEAKIASITMELESLKLNPDKDMDTSVELTTGTETGAKHTDRKSEIKCNRVACLIRKREHVQQKLAKIGDSDKPKKQAKIAKLNEKLAAITSKLEGMELEGETTSSMTPLDLKGEPAIAHPSTGIPNTETDANKQLVADVKSKFFVMKRELHQDKMQVISLMKTLKALRILSKHGASAGISLDSDKLAQTEVSLGLARDQMAAKRLIIQQQKDLVGLMKSQLGRGHCNKDWKKGRKEERKEKKEEKKAKKEEKDNFKKGRVAKSETWRQEKKLRGERRHCHKGRRCEKKNSDEGMQMSNGSVSEKME